MGIANEYMVVTIPNRGELSRLLMQCKGPDRTMAQFAEACGTISTAKLSRILNGKITRNLPVDTIVTIYENRDPRVNFSLDSLFSANGMMSLQAYEAEQSQPEEYQPDYVYNDVRNIIRNELFDRGYALLEKTFLRSDSIVRDGECQGLSKYGLHFMGFPSMYIPGLDDLRNWYFFINTREPYTADEIKEEERYLFGYGDELGVEEHDMREFLNLRASVFLADAWEPESLKGIKICWVFISEGHYKEFRKLLAGVKLNSAMSTILINRGDEKVIKEEWLNCPQDGKVQSLFDQPVQDEVVPEI